MKRIPLVPQPCADQQQYKMQCNEQSQNTSTTTKTTCPYCGVGCGVSATIEHAALAPKLSIQGDIHHPSNYGKLCIKGSNLADTLTLDRRVSFPRLGRATQAQHNTDWDTATDLIAQRFEHYIQHYGRDSIAFYVSGQLLTEDYYVVNKFVKGYLGTANIDTNSRLCMSSAVAAHKRAFGEDIVPANYADFEHTDMVVLVGSNTAWCHPILYQRILQAKAQRDLCVVVIDPRYTATCESADLHLAIHSGQDVCLFNALLQYLHQHGYADHAFIQAHTQGLDALLASSAPEQDLHDVAQRTGIAIEKLQQFFALFARTEKVMTLFSMGVNQSSRGVDKANSIINCHLLSGKIGKLGAAPFSMTGQPNAMGGREVGGLANMLAAHLELENVQHQQCVQSFWRSPHIASTGGLKAVDLFQAMEQGKIKAVWIMATNPVVSLPDADQVKRALEKCEFVVVSDVCAQTDSTAYADVLLPALAWGEKEGSVTNSERRISRQRAFLPAPAQAKPDWWALAQVAQKMGFDGFDYGSSYEIFIEHARLSAYQNAALQQREQAQVFRYFNLQGLSQLSLSEYQQLQPVQWPVIQPITHNKVDVPLSLEAQDALEQADLHGHSAPLFAQGQFAHADGRARFVATQAIEPMHACTAEYPVLLNTGRIRDQWHSMTRTGWSANLSSHITQPFCDVHPQDGLKYGVSDGGLLKLKSAWGACVLAVQFSDHVRRGQVFAPIHWNDQFASDARIGKVVNPVVDVISGEPEFTHTPVRIQPFYTQWQGVFYLRDGLEDGLAEQLKNAIQDLVWWVKIQSSHALRYEIADRRTAKQCIEQIKQIFADADQGYEWLMLEDPSAQMYHGIVLKQDQLTACLYIAPAVLLPEREWLAQLFQRKRLSATQRKALVAGQAMSSSSQQGPLVCSCFKVGHKRIIDTIQAENITDEKQLTACLKAGGNCGSCLPEIRGLIKAYHAEHADQV